MKGKTSRYSQGKTRKVKKPVLQGELAKLKEGRRIGQPIPAALKAHALRLIEEGESAFVVASLVGVCPETIRLWRQSNVEPEIVDQTAVDVVDGAAEKATHIFAEETSSSQSLASDLDDLGAVRTDLSPLSIAEQGRTTSGLAPAEIEAVLELKRRHPSMQPAQIQAQLKRFKGWRLSIRAIGRVLIANGFELVHRGSRPQGQEHPGSFEAPYRNALWQGDFGEFRIGEMKTPLLLVEDDFSRYIVIAKLMPEPTSERIVDRLKRAIRTHGRPDGFYTDRGGPFVAWGHPSSLGQYLDEQLIDHHVSAPYRPQGRGKIEALVATFRRELWDIVNFNTVDEAQRAVDKFVDYYNNKRAHMGIDGLTPADRFFGRWEEVKANMELACRNRQSAFVYGPQAGGMYSEELDIATGSAEVLRLVVVDGHVELRLFGHRVVIGELKF